MKLLRIMDEIIQHVEHGVVEHYKLCDQSIVKKWNRYLSVWVCLTKANSPFEDPGFRDLSVMDDGSLYVTRLDESFLWNGTKWVQVTGHTS